MDLRLGDCCDVLQTLGDSSVDLVITSPPYFNARSYSHFSTYDDYLDWLVHIFGEVHRVLKDGRFCCINISPVIEPRRSRSDSSTRHPIPFDLCYLLTRRGYTFIEDLVWVKPEGAAVNRGGGFYRHRKPLAYKPNVSHEYVLVFRKSCDFLIDKTIRSMGADVVSASVVADGYERSSVWHLNPDTASKHPAAFPTGLSDRLVSYYSFVGDVVLDPFMGSGTSGVSACSAGREFIGIELDASYYKMAYSRVLDAELMYLLRPTL